MRRYVRRVARVVVFIMLVAVSATPRAQQSGSTVGRPTVMPDPLAPTTPEGSQAERDKLMKAMQEDRQKKLVADTEKLLALATALHADVAKTDKNILSIDVIRRAEEIERLAHSVKERMKG